MEGACFTFASIGDFTWLSISSLLLDRPRYRHQARPAPFLRFHPKGPFIMSEKKTSLDSGSPISWPHGSEPGQTPNPNPHDPAINPARSPHRVPMTAPRPTQTPEKADAKFFHQRTR